MSSFRVSLEQITVFPHPNADLLELATVGLYHCVIPKGVYATGDYCIYVPEQSILPDELIEELGLTGRLAGKDKNRVKAIRLKSELSQGIVCRPKLIDDLCEGDWVDFGEASLDYDDNDFADILGITKWVPEIPTHMSGKVIPAPDMLPWVDIENIKRYPNIFEPGEFVLASEKVHGSCCISTLSSDGSFYVSSKGFGSKGLALEYNSDNLYWRAVEAYDVKALAYYVMSVLFVDRVGIFGEVYGKNVQDLTYGMNAGVKPGYAVFDISVDVSGRISWVKQKLVREFAAYCNIPVVPELYAGPYDEAKLFELAEGLTVMGAGANIREGLVVRPLVERRSEVTGGRAIAKFVSEKYLLRKKGTEYE